MKKKIITLAMISIVFILLVALYTDYGRKRAYAYARHFSETTQTSPNPSNKLIITDDVQVERIIKQTPLNLVFVIKWGDSQKAYVSIENWATRAHDKIIIDTVDPNRWMAIYE